MRGVWRKRLVGLLGLLLLAGCGTPSNSVHSPSSEQPSTESNTKSTPTIETGQLFDQLNIPRWHGDGIRGNGVKVAILDSGFRGYRKFLGQGLPGQVQARSFRKDGNLEARDSQHGILCAEIIHRLAPEADLLFANWEPDQPASFLDAVRWVRQEGARVLSCSLIMPSWSDGEGGGEVHAALDQLLGVGAQTQDALFFASAGNTAQRHWAGTFRPNSDGWHEWSLGAKENSLTPWGQERLAIELYGPTRTPYELFVFDRDTRQLVGQSRLEPDAQHSCGRAVVRFEPESRRNYVVALRCSAAVPRNEKIHLVVLGGNLEHATPEGSIPFPGDGTRVVSVGAVDAAGQRATYSSCGPNSRLPKPDFVALVPFPSQLRDRPFTGTSAAAPQAAGLAALVLSKHAQSSPRQALGVLRSSALDLGPAGHDCETGYGLIRLP